MFDIPFCLTPQELYVSDTHTVCVRCIHAFFCVRVHDLAAYIELEGSLSPESQSSPSTSFGTRSLLLFTALYARQAGLQAFKALLSPPPSSPKELGLQKCATMPSFILVLGLLTQGFTISQKASLPLNHHPGHELDMRCQCACLPFPEIIRTHPRLRVLRRDWLLYLLGIANGLSGSHHLYVTAYPSDKQAEGDASEACGVPHSPQVPQSPIPSLCPCRPCRTGTLRASVTRRLHPSKANLF